MAARPCQAAARPGTASTRIREASRATTQAKEVRGRAVGNGGGHGAACDKGKWFGGELTNERNGVGGADGVAARWTRRRGGAAPRVHGRGRREGEVAMGSPELLVTRPRTHRGEIFSFSVLPLCISGDLMGQWAQYLDSFFFVFCLCKSFRRLLFLLAFDLNLEFDFFF